MYSKIKSIGVENFMGYSRATVNFDESNIINFKGYNGSGKSSFILGSVVAMMNLVPSKQVNFIKHGEDYFRIKILFDDGVLILRDKYRNGQSLYEMYKDGELIYTTKQGNMLSRVNEVPETIKNYLGLIQLPEGYLNFQSRKDPLFLVETKGSQNYADLHITLKTEELSVASKLINSDKNQVAYEANLIDSQIRGIDTQLEDLTPTATTESLLVALTERETYANNLSDRESKTRKLSDSVVKINDLSLHPEVSTINTTRFGSIRKVSDTLGNINVIPSIPTVENMGSSVYSSISRVKSVLDELSLVPSHPEVSSISTTKYSRLLGLVSVIETIRGISEEPEVSSIGVERLHSLSKLSNLVKELQKVSTTLETLDKDISSISSERDTHMEELRSKGYIVCSNCGSLVSTKEG